MHAPALEGGHRVVVQYVFLGGCVTSKTSCCVGQGSASPRLTAAHSKHNLGPQIMILCGYCEALAGMCTPDVVHLL